MPGVAVFFKTRPGWPLAGGKQLHAADCGEDFDREHIPCVRRHDVGHEEVDLLGGVHLTREVAAGMEGVSVFGDGVRGLDLHAPAIASAVEDEVVAVALAPRLGNAEAETGGFMKKGGFSHLAATLGRKVCGSLRASVAMNGSRFRLRGTRALSFEIKIPTLPQRTREGGGTRRMALAWLVCMGLFCVGRTFPFGRLRASLSDGVFS
jgi:hypothetical protein